jgi:hypothetical protein
MKFLIQALSRRTSMAATVTKTCPTCFSDIDARAKKCPQCHSPLGVYRLVAVLLVFVCLFGAIGFVVLIIWGASGRHYYQEVDHPGDVKIVSSQHYFAPGYQNQSGKNATIVGSLRNDSDEALTNVKLEVRFYNAKNELIDLFEGSIGGPMKAHEEMPFKVSDSSHIHLPEAEYASHKIIAKHAYVDEELSKHRGSNQ